MCQNKGLIIHPETWALEGAFPCVRDVADINFDLCSYTGSNLNAASCFNNSYEVILVNTTYNSTSTAMMQEFADYLQTGGNLFFLHNCYGDVTSGLNQNMGILMDVIGQEEIQVDCNDTDLSGTPATLNSIHEIQCDTSYLVDYLDGGTLMGPGLANGYTVTIDAGVCMAFWHTGYGGVLGIGAEYYSSGNYYFSSGQCHDSGSIIWGFMDPEDPSCLSCEEPEDGCDDGDCLNGLEYWSQDDCLCLTELPIDPGCDDGDCTNGLETWNGCECEDGTPPNDPGCDDGDCTNGLETWDGCECIDGTPPTDPGCDDGDCMNGIEIWDGCDCIDGTPPIDPGCDDGDCNNGLEIWDGCQCVEGIPFIDPGCDDGDCNNGIEIWNGCDCERIIATFGCTDPFAENYNADANCDDGTCYINNNYYIPNVFSPSDSNPLNSQFQIQGNNIDQIQWNIYDRWGNLIYEGNDLNDHWNGNFNGQKVAQGVYVYKGNLRFLNGEEVEFKGSITVIE